MLSKALIIHTTHKLTTRTRAHTHTHTHTRTHTHTYTDTNMHTLHTCSCVHTHAHAFMHTNINLSITFAQRCWYFKSLLCTTELRFSMATIYVVKQFTNIATLYLVLIG